MDRWCRITPAGLERLKEEMPLPSGSTSQTSSERFSYPLPTSGHPARATPPRPSSDGVSDGALREGLLYEFEERPARFANAPRLHSAIPLSHRQAPGHLESSVLSCSMPWSGPWEMPRRAQCVNFLPVGRRGCTRSACQLQRHLTNTPPISCKTPIQARLEPGRSVPLAVRPGALSHRRPGLRAAGPANHDERRRCCAVSASCASR